MAREERKESLDFEELPLPAGFEPAVVFFVPGAPRIVVTHGAGGQSRLHCEHWRQILKSTASVICPRGKRRDVRHSERGYYYPDHLTLALEIHAAIAAFEAQYGSTLASEKYLYAGYSQGATMGSLALASEGATFSTLILVEGGYDDFGLSLARRFKATGGHGVLFVCGTQRCHDRARSNLGGIRSQGLSADLRWARGAGHRPDGPVARELIAGLPHFLAIDPRWQGFEPALPSVVFD